MAARVARRSSRPGVTKARKARKEKTKEPADLPPATDAHGTPDADTVSWEEEKDPKLRQKRTDYAKEVDGLGNKDKKNEPDPTARRLA